MTLEEYYSLYRVHIDDVFGGTSYWLGATRGSASLWFVYSNGYDGYSGYNKEDYFGIRPVIVI